MSAGRTAGYHEKESAWLYGEVAAAEPDPARRRALFVQARRPPPTRRPRIWVEGHPEVRRRIRRLPCGRASSRASSAASAPSPLRSILAAMKLRGLSIYTDPCLSRRTPCPTSLDEVGGRHSLQPAAKLRAAVFGVNDGLVSNASLVMGVAGAGSAAALRADDGHRRPARGRAVHGRRRIRVGALATRVLRIPDGPRARRARRISRSGSRRAGPHLPRPRHGHGRGARASARLLLSRPEQALDVLAREELGLNPDDLGSPFGAAGASFFAFAGGATIPLDPLLPRNRTGESSV